MPTLNWQKSSYSAQASDCLYLAPAEDGTIKLRESDDPATVVTTTPQNLKAFILGVKAGEFDHLAQ
ncbi:DUF397 domain-containing protein [Streptomyces sp. NA04227]|uniref:DUF397 domain-containing protein n=1 Tax=Streptomyces sp. NA04227 TaxID=2742136 RepID=UPI001590A234|nr:DUF397 domain-containing protein [Streptomyces sp. NA04227]QKW07041.1 DUF397 domain-containing protein [Streptomyces sp. NA04227]